ncbi:hypothetical protein [Microbacterium pumilum]|uniref:Peptidase C39-like domain-containing protein n=1 Tax=Microbacterium pumilum TaxID=344165 RepID=A0ABN2RSV2_9MICO
MSSVFALSFTPTGYTIAAAWPLSTTPAALTTIPLATPFTVPGLVTGALHAWSPARGKPLTVDTTKNAAVFGEFALDLWIRDARIIEPVSLVRGVGSPVELTLNPGGSPTAFWVAATIRTSGVAVVLRSAILDPGDGAIVHLGVWATGSQAVWVVQNGVAGRVELAASVPDARGKVTIGLVPQGGSSSVTILGARLRDQLDAAQESAIADAVSAGIGAIDAFIASGAAPYLGPAQGPESMFGALRMRKHLFGNVYWSPTTGAHDVSGRVLRAYEAEGGHLGPLGLPTSQEMALDAVLDYINAPRGTGASGITLGDILKQTGRLKASDFVVEGKARSKAERVARSRGWEAFATAEHRDDSAHRAAAPPIDAAWVATALGHTEDSPEVGGILRGGVRRREEGNAGRVVWMRGGGVDDDGAAIENAGRGNAARVVNAVREALHGGENARGAVWKLAIREDTPELPAEAAARVLRLPRVGVRGLKLELPAVSPVAAQAEAPADTVTVPSDAVPRLLGELGAQLASGTISASQAMGLSPHLFLRDPLAGQLVQSFGANAEALALTGIAKQKKEVGALIEAAAASRDGVRIEFEGIGWNLVGPRAQLFEHGIIVSTAQEAFTIYEQILALWLIHGGSRGFLGLPEGREAAPATKYDGPPDSRSVVFGGGRIYWSPRTGAHEVHGAILTHYLAKSSDAVALFVPPNSAHLGLPTSDEHDIEGVRGARLSTFERGSIYWTAGLGPVIVTQPILDGFLISGGVAHWGMPTGPAQVAVEDDTTVTWQTFERGVLAHTDKVGWFDALRVRIARVDTGLIDDDGAFEPEDKRGEVFVKAWVSVNGVEVLHRESPAGNNPSFAVLDGWETAGIPLREDTRIDVRIEAWDWDEASDDDHLATHSATFTFGDALFGYADTLGDYPKRKSTWNNSNEASATAVVFSYSIAPHVAATLGGLRQNNFYRFRNRGRKALPWDIYHETFADILAPDRDRAGKAEREFFDSIYVSTADGGNCYGFSTSALDAFEGRNELEQPLSDDTTTFAETGDDVWRIINRGQGSFQSASVWQWIADCQASIDMYDPRKVWARVSAALAATGKPVVLNLTGSTSGHAVLVYRTDISPAGERRMFHADSNAPWPAADADSVITVRANGSYTFNGYPTYMGPAWVSGVLPPVRMIDMPESVIAEPRVTPYWFLKSGLIGFFTGIFGSVGATVEQVEAGGRKLYGDQRRDLLDSLSAHGRKAGLLAEALGTSVTRVQSSDEAGISLRGTYAAASEMTDRIAPDLRGAKFAAQIAGALADAPAGDAVAAAWGDLHVAGPSIVTGIRKDLDVDLGGLIGALTPGAWPEAAVIDVPDDSEEGPRVIALRGRLHPDIVVTLRGRGGEYEHVMLSRSGVVAITAKLSSGGRDTVHGLSLGTSRPGVRITSDAGDRVATVRLSTDAAPGRAGVTWSVPLGIGAADASVRWMAGRPGLTVLNASPVPETRIEWSAGPAGMQGYRSPAVGGGESIRVIPHDPASPMGAIRLQRLSSLGDVVSTEIIDPSA